MFPCWNESRFKAEFIIIIRHNANYTAMCNTTTLMSIINLKNNIAVTYFTITPAILTYLIAIVLCKLPRYFINSYSLQSRLQLIDDQKFMSRLENLTKIVEHYFHNKWKHLKKPSIMQHVVIPSMLDNIEKWNLAFYR